MEMLKRAATISEAMDQMEAKTEELMEDAMNLMDCCISMKKQLQSKGSPSTSKFRPEFLEPLKEYGDETHLNILYNEYEDERLWAERINNPAIEHQDNRGKHLYYNEDKSTSSSELNVENKW